MSEEVERASCSWTLRPGCMWSPSTAICHLVNSCVLMVCHVVRLSFGVVDGDTRADIAGRRLCGMGTRRGQGLV